MTTRLNKDAAIEKIERQLDELSNIVRTGGPHRLVQWKRDTEVVLKHPLGEESKDLDDFRKIHYFYRGKSGLSPLNPQDADLLREGIHRADALLRSTLAEIKEYWIEGQPVVNSVNRGSVLHSLHPRVIEVADKLFADGHYRQAILDTFIAVVEAVKTKAQRPDLDGSPLMQHVFSQKRPILIVSSNPDEQQGYMMMFAGAVMGVRNSKAHSLVPEHDPQAALEQLSFASMLFRILDRATLVSD